MGKRNRSYKRSKQYYTRNKRRVYMAPRRAGKTAYATSMAIDYALEGDAVVYLVPNFAAARYVEDQLAEMYEDTGRRELKNIDVIVPDSRVDLILSRYVGRSSVRIIADEIELITRHFSASDTMRLLTSPHFAFGTMTPAETQADPFWRMLETAERLDPFFKVEDLPVKVNPEGIRGMNIGNTFIDEVAWSTGNTVTLSAAGGVLTAEDIQRTFDRIQHRHFQPETLQVDPVAWRALASGAGNISMGYNVVDSF